LPHFPYFHVLLEIISHITAFIQVLSLGPVFEELHAIRFHQGNNHITLTTVKIWDCSFTLVSVLLPFYAVSLSPPPASITTGQLSLSVSFFLLCVFIESGNMP
jgi:hypothetical protein